MIKVTLLSLVLKDKYILTELQAPKGYTITVGTPVNAEDFSAGTDDNHDEDNRQSKSKASKQSEAPLN